MADHMSSEHLIGCVGMRSVNTPDPDDQTEPADTPDDQTDEAATEEAQAEEEPAKPASKSIFGAKPEKPTEEEKPKSEPVSRNSIFSKVG